jgi:hypothetical protein
MTEDIWRGRLAETPLPLLFFHFWERRKSGALRLRGEAGERDFLISRGEQALAEGFFSEDLFRKRLMASRVLGVLQMEECANFAHEYGISLPRALIERGALGADRAFELVVDSWLDECLPAFDWPDGDFAFEPEAEVRAARIFTVVPTLEFILRGIRRMKNFNQIEACLPLETETVQVLSPSHAGHAPLTPSERHVLRLLHESPRLQTLYTESQLGKREAQRAVWALLALGLAGLPQSAGKVKPPADVSSGGLERTWSDFNDKCSYIFRYISKEIGPVAMNVLDKALDEVRPRLAPPLQSLDLRSDGRVELKPFPVAALNALQSESRRALVDILSEILVAEVLAVKKTLGNDHEAAVVKGLEKVGESS